jgi:2-methylcitrate dehydratase PrpD
MRLSEKIAEFVYSFCPSNLTSSLLQRTKNAILDYSGVLLAGTDEESVLKLRHLINNLGGNQQSSVWGTGIKTSVAFAALLNATTAHALDYDDTNTTMLAHPSIHLLPGLFSLAETLHCSGIDILTAYVTGFETGALLGKILNPEHVRRGWLPIGTIGPVMQAVACARLLGLNRHQIRMALGHAVNTASGLRCNNGSMAKHLLAGQASFNGTMAALYAQNGITSSSSALEEHLGYIQAFGGKLENISDSMSSLGKSYALSESGINFKLYPCCAAAHGAIDCAVSLAKRMPFDISEITEIRVLLHSSAKKALIHTQPTTVAEARFSLAYCLTRAFLDKTFGPHQFQPEFFKDATWRKLAKKINLLEQNVVMSSEDVNQNKFPVEICVVDSRNHTITERVEYAKGTPSNPLSQKDLEIKFKHCCMHKFNIDEIKMMSNIFNFFEKIENINELLSFFLTKR